MEVVWTDRKHHMVSSVDFVYLYCRKSKADFTDEIEFEKFKELNSKLFDKLRNPDDLLLSCAVTVGVVSETQTRLVKDIRTIRNLCSHFNPFESTIKSYKDAVHNLDKNIDLSYDVLSKEVATAVLMKTRELLSDWEKRVVSSAFSSWSNGK